MARRATYHIPDEPRPGGLAQWIVDPFWPLLATMMAGAWLGLPWLAFNGVALGSPTLKREIGVCLIAGLGTFAILLGVAYATSHGVVETRWARYLLLLAVGWKLGCAYVVCFMQQNALQLYEYFGGTKRNGAAVLIAGAFFVRPAIIGATKSLPFLYALL